MLYRVMLIVLVCCFFFNDPATTEIYTSSHTLSLHDALPISRQTRQVTPRPALQRGFAGASSPRRRGSRNINEPRFSAALPGRHPRVGGDPETSMNRASARLCRGVIPAKRSEEHTSELQSLMRISYAVFCLKKKKQNTHQQKYMYNMLTIDKY